MMSFCKAWSPSLVWQAIYRNTSFIWSSRIWSSSSIFNSCTTLQVSLLSVCYFCDCSATFRPHETSESSKNSLQALTQNLPSCSKNISRRLWLKIHSCQIWKASAVLFLLHHSVRVISFYYTQEITVSDARRLTSGCSGCLLWCFAHKMSGWYI